MTEAEFNEFITRSEAEALEADRQYNEKLRALNKRKRERSKKLKEMGVHPYAGQKHGIGQQTICFDCRNSCPNPNKHTGCEWSIGFKPVPGWNAVQKNIRPNYPGNQPIVSYVVLDCPKFVQG